MVVVILPFCVPDNICHFAAQEAAMTVDQYISPDVDRDLMSGVKDTIHTFQKLDSYFAAIMYQVQTLAFANSDSNLDPKSFLSSPISSMGV